MKKLDKQVIGALAVGAFAGIMLNPVTAHAEDAQTPDEENKEITETPQQSESSDKEENTADNSDEPSELGQECLDESSEAGKAISDAAEAVQDASEGEEGYDEAAQSLEDAGKAIDGVEDKIDNGDYLNNIAEEELDIIIGGDSTADSKANEADGLYKDVTQTASEASKALETIDAEKDSYNDADQIVRDAQKAINNAKTDLETANARLEEAKKAYEKACDAMANLDIDAAAAHEQLELARQMLAAAEEDLSKAQNTLTEKQAQKDKALSDLENELKDLENTTPVELERKETVITVKDAVEEGYYSDEDGHKYEAKETDIAKSVKKKDGTEVLYVADTQDEDSVISHKEPNGDPYSADAEQGFENRIIDDTEVENDYFVYQGFDHFKDKDPFAIEHTVAAQYQKYRVRVVYERAYNEGFAPNEEQAYQCGEDYAKRMLERLRKENPDSIIELQAIKPYLYPSYVEKYECMVVVKILTKVKNPNGTDYTFVGPKESTRYKVTKYIYNPGEEAQTETRVEYVRPEGQDGPTAQELRQAIDEKTEKIADAKVALDKAQKAKADYDTALEKVKKAREKVEELEEKAVSPDDIDKALNEHRIALSALELAQEDKVAADKALEEADKALSGAREKLKIIQNREENEKPKAGDDGKTIDDGGKTIDDGGEAIDDKDEKTPEDDKTIDDDSDSKESDDDKKADEDDSSKKDKDSKKGRSSRRGAASDDGESDGGDGTSVEDSGSDTGVPAEGISSYTSLISVDTSRPGATVLGASRKAEFKRMAERLSEEALALRDKEQKGNSENAVKTGSKLQASVADASKSLASAKDSATGKKASKASNKKIKEEAASISGRSAADKGRIPITLGLLFAGIAGVSAEEVTARRREKSRKTKK
jgi:hypothetical protein